MVDEQLERLRRDQREFAEERGYIKHVTIAILILACLGVVYIVEKFYNLITA